MRSSSAVSKTLLSSTAASQPGALARHATCACLLLCFTVVIGGLGGCAPRDLDDGPPLVRLVAVSPETSAYLEERVAALGRQHDDLELTITDEEMSSYVITHVPFEGVRELAVWFTSDSLHLCARVHALGWRTLSAEVALTCSDGHLRPRIRRAWVDQRPLPRWLLDSLEAAIRDALVDARIPWRCEGVEMAQGEMTVRGRRVAP